MGFRKVALETREPGINEDIGAASAAIGRRSSSWASPCRQVRAAARRRSRVGAICPELDREQASSDDDVRLPTTLAGSLTATENAWLFEETRQRNAELALVNDVQRKPGEPRFKPPTISSATDPGHLRRNVADIDPERNSISCTTCTDERGVRYLDEPMDPDESYSLSRYVIDRAEEGVTLAWVSERMREFGEMRVMGSGEVPKSVLFVPLVVGGRAIGRISLQNLDREHAFSEADARLLTTLAASLSVTLENLRLFDESQRRGSEMAALAELGREVGGLLDLVAVINRIGERAKDLLRADTSAVFLEEGRARSGTSLVALGKSAELIMADAISLGEGGSATWRVEVLPRS